MKNPSLFLRAVPISEIGELTHALVYINNSWYEAKKNIQTGKWQTTSGYLLSEPEFFFPIPSVPTTKGSSCVLYEYDTD